MKRHALPVKNQDNDIKKFYILTRPASLSSLNLDEIEDYAASGWREKSRQMQLRRWRKIKHQIA